VTRAWITLVAITGLLAGCAVGPDYRRPAVAEPAMFRGQAAADAASLADLPWWEAFKDPALKGLIDEALRQSYDVRIAAARVEEARAQAGVARSQFFPQLDYRGGVQRTRNIAAILGVPQGGEPTTNDLYNVGVSMSWELDIWGRIRRSNEAARANFLASEDARRGVWLSLVSDLARAYFELLSLDVRLAIARDSTGAFQATFDLFEDRFRFGVASRLQTTRAEGALGAAEAAIPDLESQIVAKENQINLLIGKSPGPVPRGAPMYAQAVVPTVPAGLPSTLLERRPDLREAEQKLVRANALVGVAKADFFPRLSLTGLVGAASPELTALTSGGAFLWSVAAALTGPIFQGGRIKANYEAQLAVWEQARLQYEQAVLAALREVSDALTLLAKLSDAETGQARAVRALEEAVAHAMDRYRYGLANYYEVLEAQQLLYPAQGILAQLRRDRLVAYVQLYRSLGGGWNLSDAQWSDPTKVPTVESPGRVPQ
jgi:outer membrane protein, multidrug efflux system